MDVPFSSCVRYNDDHHTQAILRLTYEWIRISCLQVHRRTTEPFPLNERRYSVCFHFHALLIFRIEQDALRATNARGADNTAKFRMAEICSRRVGRMARHEQTETHFIP